MSHVTTIKTEIKDLDCLKNACKAIGLQFQENQKTHRFYSNQTGKCDHAISVPNNKEAYEIGVVKDGDKFSLNADFWNGGYGLEKIAGRNCSNLVDEYTKISTIKQAKKFADAQGYFMSEEFDEETNEVVLKLRKY